MLGKLEFISKIAEKDGFDRERIERIGKYIFNDLEKQFKSCEHPFISVKNLGTFILNSNAVQRRLKQLLSQYKSYKKSIVLKKGNIYNSKRAMIRVKEEIRYLFGVKSHLKEVNQQLLIVKGINAKEIYSNNKRKLEQDNWKGATTLY